MSALHTQIMSQLATSLEGTIRVASVVFRTCALAMIRRMSALHSEIMGKLASSLEGTIRVTLEVVSRRV